MVEWQELIWFINRKRSDSDPCQKKILSMNRFHIFGSNPPTSCHWNSISNSTIPMKMQANVGLLLDPMATPSNCRNSFLSKTKKFEDATNLIIFKRKSVGMDWSSLLSIAALKALRPWSIGTMLYIPFTPNVTGTVPGTWSFFTSGLAISSTQSRWLWVTVVECFAWLASCPWVSGA